MRFSRPVSPFSLSLLFAVVAATAPARADSLRLPITTRLEASATWAENIARSSSPTNWRDSLRQDTTVTASLLTPLVTGVSLITELDASYEAIPRYELNNAFTAGLHTQVRWKFGLGAFAPVLATEVGISHRDVRYEGADGWHASGALRLSKRFSDSWRASITGDWSQVYATDAPFDVRHHRFFGSLTYDLNAIWQLTYGRGSLWGDITANASPDVWARAEAGFIGSAVARYYNTVSDEVTGAYGPNWISYRVTARTDFWWLELAPAVGRNTSLPLRFESNYTVNLAGVQYRQTLWTISVLHRF